MNSGFRSPKQGGFACCRADQAFAGKPVDDAGFGCIFRLEWDLQAFCAFPARDIDKAGPGREDFGFFCLAVQVGDRRFSRDEPAFVSVAAGSGGRAAGSRLPGSCQVPFAAAAQAQLDEGGDEQHDAEHHAGGGGQAEALHLGGEPVW